MDQKCRRLLFFMFISLLAAVNAQLNITTSPTAVLQSQPSFSAFRKLLTDTGVAAEIDQRSSLTLLLPENSLLEALVNRSGNPLPLPIVADVLRYHCLLQYLDIPQIKSMTNNLGMLITSLYQTTGRAAGQNGFVNISVAGDGKIHAGLPFASSFNATLMQNITQFPYNISYIQIDNVLVPSDLGRPQAAAATILNFTSALQRSGRFNTFLNLMQSTGLTATLATLPSYSVFVPNDEAFQALPRGTLEALSPSQATSLLAYHTLPAYSSFDALQKQNSFVQTLASNGDNQKFLVQLSAPASAGNNPSVSLSTGVDTAQVVSSIYDQPPASAYSINRVLLPKEIFVVSSANDSSSTSSPTGSPALAPVLSPAAAAASPLLSAITPVVSAAPPPSSSSQEQDQAPLSSTSPAPVVDVGNLPPASGPGAASTDMNNQNAATLPKSSTGVLFLLFAACLLL